MNERIDHARVEQLAIRLLQPINANYKQGPRSRDRVHEALNALAFAVVTVVANTGDAEKALGFFTAALQQNFAEHVSKPPDRLQ